MPTLTADETSLLEIFLDRVIPPDEDPGAVEAGVMGYVESRFAADPATVEVYRAGLILLEARGFGDLPANAQDAVIDDLAGHSTIAAMIAQVIEGYYAGPESVGARMMGFRVTA